MAGQSPSPRSDRNQNGSLRAVVASVRRATDRHHSARASRPNSVLDCVRLGGETHRFPALLQCSSHACWDKGPSTRTGRFCPHPALLLSLAKSLPSVVPDSCCGMIYEFAMDRFLKTRPRFASSGMLFMANGTMTFYPKMTYYFLTDPKCSDGTRLEPNGLTCSDF